jgi:outer membrane protein
MKLIGSCAMAAVMALLTGCMSAPRPVDSSTPWTPPEDAKKTDQVWKEMREQKRDFSKPLTLSELTDLALQSNPATRRSWHDARAAAAQVEQARGYFMPTIVGTAEATRQQISADPEEFDQKFTRYGPGLQVNYLILNVGGGRQAAVEAALQIVYAQDFLFNKSIQDVLLAVETAYYNVISAHANMEALEASVKDAKMSLETAQERKNAGVGTELEVLQARASYDQSLYNLAGAKGQYKIARASLAQAVGVPADSSIEVVAPTVEVPHEIALEDMQVFIDESLQRRPDIASLRATLAARQAAIRVAGSPLWPSLYFNGGINRNYYSSQSGKDLQDDDWSYLAGLSLQWTLFDGLQTINARRAAVEQAESAREQLKQAELAASSDVWTRYYLYDTALQRYKFSLAFLNSASASYELALSSYKAGLNSILDLLNAETQLAQARSQQVAARQEAFIALANLAYATGLLEKGGATETGDLFINSSKKE